MKERKRHCNGCTKCCEGWLSGNAYGYEFWPGRKCHFCHSEGCTIYNDRPKDPCVDFKCAWLTGIDLLPEWMKPSECGAIARWLEIDGETYLDIMECGKRLDPAILSWLFLSHAQGKVKNIRWQLDGGHNYIGNDAFIKAMRQ